MKISVWLCMALIGLSFPACAECATALPAALRPALYRTMADDAGADTIGKNGCVTLTKQALTACFTSAGVRFVAAQAKPLALRIAAWGRGTALHAIRTTHPEIASDRVRYVHGALAEWWRVLPTGFEQGFTVKKRPDGKGKLTFVLAATGNAEAQGDTIAFGHLHYGGLVVTDAAGRIVPSALKTRGDRILISVTDARARYPLTVDPLVWSERKVAADDGAAFDELGWSVAMDGDTALVGARYATVGGNLYQGAVYVFTRSGESWYQTQKLTADDGAENGEFGYSLALSGGTALIGTPGAIINGHTYQGAVYVFTDSGGTWSQAQKLSADDGAAFDELGWSVALDGTTALLGAPYAAIGGNSYQGAAYVFTDSGGTWSQAQKLSADDGGAYDYFGQSAALDGGTALIGAPFATVGGNLYQGAAYVFTDSGGTWSQAQKLTAADGATNDNFGFSVALDGTNALIGSYLAAVGDNTNQGAVYAYTDSGGTWTQTQKLTAADGVAFAFFGNAIAMSGTRALIGAYGTDIGANGLQGAAYLFALTNGTWSQAARLVAGDGATGDQFADAVALSGATALFGAYFANIGSNDFQGAAYFDKLFPIPPCPQDYIARSGVLGAGDTEVTAPYQAPAGVENAILGGPDGFRLYAQYSNGGPWQTYRIPGNEIHQHGPVGTYRWGVKAGSTGGAYLLCLLHP